MERSQGPCGPNQGETIIYEGERHRDPSASRWVLVAILVVIAGMCAYELIAAAIRGELPRVFLVAPAPILFLGWAVYNVFRRSSALPDSVSILETGFVRFRSQHDEETYAADQFYLIEYVHDSSEGTLLLRTSRKAWHLPCSREEAERVIAAIAAFNPGIGIERREDWGMAG